MLKKPIFNTVIQILGKGIMVALALFSTGWLTRKMGVDVYGKFTLISAVFLLLDAMADFGLRIIGVRELALAENEKKKEKMFNQMVWLRWMMTGGAFIIGLGMILWWPDFRNIKLAALLSLSMIWMTSLAGSLEIVYQERMKMMLKVVMDVMFPLLFVVIILVYPGKTTLVTVMAMYLVARFISLAIGWIGARVRNFKFEFDGKEIKRLFKETWPMGVYLIVFTSYDRAVDSLLISRFMGAKEVAWYGLAYKVYVNLLQPAYFFVNSVFPLMSSKSEDKRKLFNVSLGLLFAGVALMIPLVYLLAPWMISMLAGSGFEPSVGALRILIWATLFSYVGHLFGFTLISRKGQKSMLYLGIIVLVFNITMNLWLIPRMGIYGAALVTVMTEALGCALMGWSLRRTVLAQRS
jgi:PST family polysaccharide transporter